MDYLEALHHLVAYLRTRRKIFKASMHSLDGAFARKDHNEGITLELFLCGMYFVFGRRFLGRFDDPNAFLRMQQELVPNGKLSSLRRWQTYRKIPGGQAIFGKYEERLTRILWNAMRIAKASSIRTNGLPEFMAALCLDEEVVRDLKLRWGFMPRDYLEPRSLFKPPTPSL